MVPRGILAIGSRKAIFAIGRRLNPFLLNLSIIIDMVMALGLIWSFHIQYMQPSGFYLKAPTFVLLFVFIALRALRYDPKFVLFSGIFAALGWAGLTLYALNRLRGKGGRFYRLHHEYPHPGRRSGGKIISLLAVTFILYFGTRKSQQIFPALQSTAMPPISSGAFSPRK
jgi:adenylate cyclase